MTGDQMDCGQRWIMAADGLWPEIGDQTWIPSRFGSIPDMHCDWIWNTGGWLQELDLLGSILGDEWQSISFLIQRCWGFDKIYNSRDHNVHFDVRCFYMESRDACTQCTGSMAPSSTIRSTTQCRILSCSPRYWIMPKCSSCYLEHDPESDPKSQPIWWYSTSLMWLIFGGEMIIKERDDSAGITTTPTVNYLTGNAGMKYHETHSPIENTSSGKCIWRRSTHGTTRTMKVHAKKWWQMHLQINQEAAYLCNIPEWNLDSVSEIPTQSRQFWDTQPLPEIHSRIKPSQMKWQQMKLELISCLGSYHV